MATRKRKTDSTVSRLVVWLILLSLAGALAFASLGGRTHMPYIKGNKLTALVVDVGPAVADVGVSDETGGGEKVQATITLAPGGGAYNSTISADAFGAPTALVSLTGADHLSTAVVEMMRDRLPCVLPARLLDRTRISAVIDGHRSYVQRHPVRRPLPPAHESLIRQQAQVLVVAPFQAEDYPFVSRLLALGRPQAYRILMLSKEQARDPRSLNLIRQADLVVLGRDELREATGTDDLRDGICRLAVWGARSVLATAGAAGVAGRFDGGGTGPGGSRSTAMRESASSIW